MMLEHIESFLMGLSTSFAFYIFYLIAEKHNDKHNEELMKIVKSIHENRIEEISRTWDKMIRQYQNKISELEFRIFKMEKEKESGVTENQITKNE